MKFDKASGFVSLVIISTPVAGSYAATAPTTDSLDEIVITATRQDDTVHNVPLTITAISNVELDEQGIKRGEDLIQAVTSLRISGANSGGNGSVGGSAVSNAQISIRGIASSVAGAAPTTGIYIDDVPLQQRNSLGITGGGTALPLLFDLERIEVLKGPQGTLYGGSSEGGTLRFITTQPSLTNYALYTRAEGNGTRGGDGGYEYGLSVGAPLINDVLGVRVSGLVRHDGGYLDHISQFSGDTLASNTNGADHDAFRASALWQIAPGATALVAYSYQREHYADTDNYWLNIPQYQATVGPNPAAPTTYTYGPYDQFGTYRSGANTNIGKNFYTSDAQLSPLYAPHTQSLSLPSVTLEYRVDPISIKSITAYSETINRTEIPVGFSDITGQGKNVFTPPIDATVEGPFNALPGNSPFIANLPVSNADFTAHSRNTTLSEELRISSTTTDSPFKWVAGIFLDRTTDPAIGVINANLPDVVAAIIHGVSQGPTPSTPELTSPSSLTERQRAIYAEGTYSVIDALRFTVGVRYSRDTLEFSDEVGGGLFGFPPGLLIPSASGSITSSATTPKFGLQYVLDPNTNFYVSASQGYRPGGLNPTLPPNCQAAAVAAGYAAVPQTFGSDKLWSYEGGVKLRAWDGRANINAAAFYIDWTKVQTTIDLGCGQLFADNASKEVSQGVDFEGSVLLVPGLTTTLRAAYTDAHFVGDQRTPAGTSVLINDGDRVLYTPKTQADLGLEYKFPLAGQSAFVRADYSYQGPVATSYGPGTVSYTPDNKSLPGADIMNLRAGINIGKFQASAYVLNVTNSEDLLFRGGFSVGPGRYGCQNAACSVYNKVEEGGVASTYRPRTIGVVVSYRY